MGFLCLFVFPSAKVWTSYLIGVGQHKQSNIPYSTQLIPLIYHYWPVSAAVFTAAKSQRAHVEAITLRFALL